MTRPRQAASLALGLVVALAARAAEPALSQDELLRSVDRALPLIEQARRDIDAASGQLLAAKGAFDLYASASGKRLLGEYDNSRLETRLTQPLSLWGIDAYGGYSIGQGSFAGYDGKAQTRADGEALLGVELPLLRDRAIDARRTERQNAELELDRAEQQLDAARLSNFAKALSLYWDWAAAGRQLDVARALLQLAEARDQQLADAVALGHMAAVERTDNQRSILQRRSALAAAQRVFEQRSIELSLYYRGIDGKPLRLGPERLPTLPAADAAREPDEAAEVDAALQRRPEVQSRRLKLAQQRTEAELADNTLLPSLKLYSEVTRDYGDGKVKTADEDVAFGFKFALPLQRRKAAGSSAKARAYVARTEQELRWAEDQVRAEVQDALSAVRAARATLDAVAGELVVARELEALERDRFELGDSTQFLVNLRELAAADAAVRELRARADLQKALAGLDTATGRLLSRVPAS